MRLIFLHYGNGDHILPITMIRSVRRWIDVEVVQMTDDKSAMVPGVDTVSRAAIPEGMSYTEYRLRHINFLAGEPFIHLDTDVIVQRDLMEVFEQDFDVALTRRYGKVWLKGKNIVEDEPYNAGVFFSRTPGFWKEMIEHYDELTDYYKRWRGDQFLLAKVAATGKYKVLDLDCKVWNRTPNLEKEDVGDSAVVHYKGHRKPWMLKRAYEQVTVI